MKPKHRLECPIAKYPTQPPTPPGFKSSPPRARGLRLKAWDRLFELAKYSPPLLPRGLILPPPYPSSRAGTTKIEPQKAEAFAPAKVYDSAFLFIHFDIEL